jgi:hypothetical protein
MIPDAALKMRRSAGNGEGNDWLKHNQSGFKKQEE